MKRGDKKGPVEAEPQTEPFRGSETLGRTSGVFGWVYTPPTKEEYSI